MASEAGAGVADVAATVEILSQAITRRRCVTALYNKAVMTLAPHMIFTRHDEEYLGAVTVDQDGRKPARSKVGTFKLTGLKSVTLTGKLFSPLKEFDPEELARGEPIVCMITRKA